MLAVMPTLAMADYVQITAHMSTEDALLTTYAIPFDDWEHCTRATKSRSDNMEKDEFVIADIYEGVNGDTVWSEVKLVKEIGNGHFNFTTISCQSI